MAANIPSRRRRRRASEKGMGNTAFEEGTDFIPLDAGSDNQKVQNGKAQDENARGKGKEREPNRTGGKGMENAAFEDGTDFIPLAADSDDENVEKGKDQDRNARGKGKERERERTRAANSPRPPSASPPPLPSSSRQDDSDSRDRRHTDSRENGQGNGHTREWDRGKRKYDMIFDPSDGYQNKKQRTDAKSRLAPWVEEVDWEGCENAAELCVTNFWPVYLTSYRLRFHREVEGFVNWISPTPQEDEIRGLIVAIISRAVTTSFPDASVFPFGSYATKLYLPLG